LDVLAKLGVMVRMWRHAGALLMHGPSTGYAAEPRGEYFVGVIEHGAMRARRGGRRYDAGPGDLCVWDPSGPHRGAGAWTARLMVLEEPGPLAGREFPRPIVHDAGLAARFAAAHRALSGAATGLERDVVLAECLAELAGLVPAAEPRDDPALRRAREYLLADLAAQPTLDELAAVAGVGKYRLIRLFRAAEGMPPHRYLLAQRVRRARRLLETGHPIAEVAAVTGFSDQSHLHRQFRRALDVTPGEYAARFRR
jgi:AraC-like DNA-binding protein